MVTPSLAVSTSNCSSSGSDGMSLSVQSVSTSVEHSDVYSCCYFY